LRAEPISKAPGRKRLSAGGLKIGRFAERRILDDVLQGREDGKRDDSLGLLTEADYKKAAQAGGFTGNIIVGTDLASVRLPVK
jgi:hypothetical protein